LGLPNAHLGLPNADLGLPNAHSCPLNMKGESHSKFPKFLDFFFGEGVEISIFFGFFFVKGLFPQGWKTISPYNIKSFPLGLLMK
jgi:hypothetical protein